jgi:phosphatidylglycerophosphatase A
VINTNTNLTSIHKTIASVLGIGYIKHGSGTIASAVCCIFWFLLHQQNNFTGAFVFTIAVTAIGIWSAGKMENEWGHDSRRVVIDEVAGMSISLLWLPVNLNYVVAAFLLFRFFDIYKPLFINRLENLKGGWGVMLDDVLAGMYTNLILQLSWHWNWF